MFLSGFTTVLLHDMLFLRLGELGFFFVNFVSEFDMQRRTSEEADAYSVSSSTRYNPLDEPSPLGLSLRKSPSLLDLIQAKLSQETAKLATLNKKVQKGVDAFSSVDNKLKASNFPALILKIGSWEVLCIFFPFVYFVNGWVFFFCFVLLRMLCWLMQYKSRYEGDLVAKCYFAKHKLVWELLDGNLKNKIEIQWSDIVALKANYAEDGFGTLDIVVSLHFFDAIVFLNQVAELELCSSCVFILVL